MKRQDFLLVDVQLTLVMSTWEGKFANCLMYSPLTCKLSYQHEKPDLHIDAQRPYLHVNIQLCSYEKSPTVWCMILHELLHTENNFTRGLGIHVICTTHKIWQTFITWINSWYKVFMTHCVRLCTCYVVKKKSDKLVHFIAETIFKYMY